MQTTVFFALPGIYLLPTGGNLYNRFLSRALQGKKRIIPFFPEKEEQLPEGLSNGSIVLLDSLLMEFAPQIKRRYPGVILVLMLHYLKQLDPSQDKSSLPSLDLSLFSGVITTSNYSKLGIVEAGYPSSSVFVVYPGKDERFMPGSGRSSTKCFHMLTVANHLPGKGLLEFVSILEGLDKKEWSWHIIGDQSLHRTYSSNLLTRIRESHCSGQIHVIPPCSGSQLVQRYHEASLFVLPSFFETLSMVTREALSCGLPVLAYDVGGLSESVEHGRNGKLIESGNTERFRQELESMISNRAMTEKMGHQAVKSAQKFPLWSESAQAFDVALNTISRISGSREQ